MVLLHGEAACAGDGARVWLGVCCRVRPEAVRGRARKASVVREDGRWARRAASGTCVGRRVEADAGRIPTSTRPTQGKNAQSAL